MSNEGWYPDPDRGPGTERYWDGRGWSAYRPPLDVDETASTTVDRIDRVDRDRRTRALRHVGWTLLVLVGTLAYNEWAPNEQAPEEVTEPDGQACVRAVLSELHLLHAEVGAPTMTGWSDNRHENPLLAAHGESWERCRYSGRGPYGFDWSGVQEDYEALRAHLEDGDPAPAEEDLTPIADIEAWLR